MSLPHALSAQTFYDIDFEAPLHIAGSLVTTGDSTGTPTSIVTGNPTISSPIASGFPSQSLWLSGGTSPQINLNLGHRPLGYAIEFDVLPVGVIESDYAFGIYLDTPYVRNVQLASYQGQVRVYPGSGSGVFVGPYADNTIHHFFLAVNLRLDQWSVDMDGTQLFSAPFGAEDIESVRFGFSTVFPQPRNPDAHAYLDNVRISVIPEPSTFAMSLTMFAAFVASRRAALKANRG